MYLNLENSPSCIAKNPLPHSTMFCPICSQQALYYCPCRVVKYCSKSCQTTHWKQHKAEHKHVMRTLEEAMAPRRESTEDLMRWPFERELSIIAGPHMGKQGKLWYYDPSDNTYEIILCGPVEKLELNAGCRLGYSAMGAAVVSPRHLHFKSFVLDMIFQSSDAQLRREHEKAMVLDRMQCNGGNAG